MLLTYGEIKNLFPNNTLTMDESAEVVGISKDTRAIKAGEIYVAIKGENHDGHDHMANAIKQGAAAIIAERNPEDLKNVVIVPDTIKALGKLAAHYRKKFSQPVIAITGSSGKTTTKELLAHVLGLDGPVVATQGNLNNAIGVPFTVFTFNEQAKYFLVEMGMSHLEEIRYLARMVKPTNALITSIGHAHLEGVGGTIEGVAQAKGELFEELSSTDTAFYFADCPHISSLATKAQKVTYGFEKSSHFFADQIKITKQGTEFVLHTPTHHDLIRLSLVGKHQVQNALAVTAVAVMLGLSFSTIKKGLESFVLTMNRGKRIVCGNITLIDDTYNANPDSLLAAMTALAEEFPLSLKILALGGMRELGDAAPELHELMGSTASSLGIDGVFAHGEHGRDYLAGYGYPDDAVNQRFFTDHTKMANAIIEEINDQNALTSVVLVKGSRAMTMEKVFTLLREEFNK